MFQEMKLLYWMVCKKIDSSRSEHIVPNNLINQINMDVFLDVVRHNKCIPIVIEYIDLFDGYAQHCILDEYQHFLNKNRCLLSAAKEIVKAAAKENIQIIDPKGIALALTIYGDINHRQFADLDFLVPIRELKKLGNLLVEMGFFHRHNGPIAEICDVMQYNLNSLVYEIKFFRFLRDPIRIDVELKKATDAIPYRLITEFYNNLVSISLDDNICYQTFSPEYLLLHLCSNIYVDHYEYEGVFSNAGKLRDFVDLYFFCKNVMFDYDRLNQLARQYNMGYCLEFCQAMMQELFAISVFHGKNSDDIDFTKFPSMEIILQGKKKEFFLKKYQSEQILFDQQKLPLSECYTYFFKGSNITLTNCLSCSSKIDISLCVSKSNLQLLHERRMYLCFVKGLENTPISDTVNVDSYYMDNQTIVIYSCNDMFYYYQDTVTLFKVPNSSTNNNRLSGKNIESGIYSKENINLSFEFYIPEHWLSKHIYFNVFADLRLLNDYYKHDEYLFTLGDPFQRIK
ncbi:MAG: hypothetical protein K0S01_2456 [Herbinix sp.]|jgi:hypothetical protein|nr:hypothetical protein [Herbinix sp.]